MITISRNDVDKKSCEGQEVAPRLEWCGGLVCLGPDTWGPPRNTGCLGIMGGQGW